MKSDKINFRILDDGTIKIDTDGISQPNHVSAERFLATVAQLAGGTTEIKHKHGRTGHFHTHTEGEHEHEGH